MVECVCLLFWEREYFNLSAEHLSTKTGGLFVTKASLLIHEADPTVTTNSDHNIRKCRTSVSLSIPTFQNRAKIKQYFTVGQHSGSLITHVLQKFAIHSRWNILMFAHSSGILFQWISSRLTNQWMLNEFPATSIWKWFILLPVIPLAKVLLHTEPTREWEPGFRCVEKSTTEFTVTRE